MKEELYVIGGGSAGQTNEFALDQDTAFKIASERSKKHQHQHHLISVWPIEKPTTPAALVELLTLVARDFSHPSNLENVFFFKGGLREDV